MHKEHTPAFFMNVCTWCVVGIDLIITVQHRWTHGQFFERLLLLFDVIIIRHFNPQT